jgi:hypothetical protein
MSVFKHAIFRRRAVIADFRFHIHRARLRRNLRRGDERAIPGDVQRFGDDQPHVAVNAAAENVFARARASCGFHRLLSRTATTLSPVFTAPVMSKENPV